MKSQVSKSWVGEVLADRYQVVAPLGEGGMAFVYRARDKTLNSDVVVKVPRPSMLAEPGFAERFAREIRSLVQLRHPHIVTVFDVGKHLGCPFVVLQYLTGGSLRDQQAQTAKRKRAGSTFEALRRWLPDVAAALDFVHQQGYLHRDVKPDNILFDEHGHVYLSDFGIVKALGQGNKARGTELTGLGMVVGTPQYMAPELVMGEAYDGRADQFSLAVTVYELLSGTVPFEGVTPAAVALKQMAGSPPSLQKVRPSVPTEVAKAVERALAIEPAKRFPDCGAFARAVCQALADARSDAPVKAQAIGSSETARAAATKNRTRKSLRPRPAATLVAWDNPLLRRGLLIGAAVIALLAIGTFALLSAGFCIGSLVIPSRLAKNPLESDLDSFQGTWIVVSFTADGKPLPADNVKGIEVTFEGDKMITRKDGSETKMNVRLDPTKSPKEIDVEFMGKTGKGIYQLEGDSLKIAHRLPNNPRPNSFDGNKGSGVLVSVYKRIKK